MDMMSAVMKVDKWDANSAAMMVFLRVARSAEELVDETVAPLVA